MNQRMNRRTFVHHSVAAASATLLLGSVPSCTTAPSRVRRKISPNEKLNLGVIGTHNRAAEDIKGVQGENIVAICDIDTNYLDAAQRQFPGAKRYTDFRKLLEQNDIDAVVVGTPDHTHAVATVAALRSGRHVYCEKPLTHTISEARVVMAATRETGLVTQMGNQIHATEHYRRVVEIVRSGALGAIREVHCWVDGAYENKPRPEGETVPPNLDYEQWLGPVEFQPYSKEYVPFKWRGWWAFGGGTLSDFCCHLTDLAFWALDLKHPLTIEAEGPAVHQYCVPPWLIVRYEYAARADAPPVKVIWYSGKRPPITLPRWGNGVLFVGDKGMLLTDYSRMKLLPEEKFQGFIPPAASIPKSVGHHQEWIDAIKTNGPTTCNFAYGGLLTEAGLLGNVAYRTGRKLEWDAQHIRAKNCPEAEQFIHHHYRPGWRI